MQIIIAIAFLTFALSFNGGSAICEESRKLEADCGNYCFNVVRPLLQHVTALKEQVDGREDQSKVQLKNIELLLERTSGVQKVFEDETEGRLENIMRLLERTSAAQKAVEERNKDRLESIERLLEQASELQKRVEIRIDQQDVRLTTVERLLADQEKIIDDTNRLTRENGVRQLGVFEKVGSKYYLFGKYHRLSWVNALHKCQELGANLVSFKNQAEFDEVTAKMRNHNFWVDIRADEASIFISTTTGRPADFLKWMPGEPNNNGNSEKCVEARLFENKYAMNDFNCDYEFPMVCELPSNEVEQHIIPK